MTTWRCTIECDGESRAFDADYRGYTPATYKSGPIAARAATRNGDQEAYDAQEWWSDTSGWAYNDLARWVVDVIRFELSLPEWERGQPQMSTDWFAGGDLAPVVTLTVTPLRRTGQ